MSSSARNSLVWFNGLNFISAGGSAEYRNGGFRVSKSWTPMATKVRFRHMLWWSFSCSSIKLSYPFWVKLTLRRIAVTTNGRTAFVDGDTVIVTGFGGVTLVYCGVPHFPKKMFRALDNPSTHKRSYRFAGISILYWTGSLGFSPGTYTVKSIRI